MTSRVKLLKDFFIEKKEHYKFRKDIFSNIDLAKTYSENKLSDFERSSDRICRMLKENDAIVFPDERITITRTITKIPDIFTKDEWENRKKNHKIHELGDVCNINVDYTKLMDTGINSKIDEIKKLMADNKYDNRYYQSILNILYSIIDFAKRYRIEALKIGNTEVAKVLERVPENAPRTFVEALQMFRIIHFTLWCGGNYHNTVGRFDQYMYKFFINDINNGTHNYESALELLEEFFITFNRDSDLYPGIQQGDNGQSMVLGGRDVAGNTQYNLLSELCLKASLELKLIDPKINLRVDKNTPIEIFELGTKLTKQGLGFPQYFNDDINIDGLEKLGYSKEDAHNYAVAACWELIIPGKGMDIPNIDAISFAQIVNKVIKENLVECKNFSELLGCVKKEIQKEIDIICNRNKNVLMIPAPFVSVMMDGCIENCKDISFGNLYNNYGIHGTGIATAVDSLTVVKTLVYDTKKISTKQLLKAMENNYKDNTELLNMVKSQASKMGNNEEVPDNIAIELIDFFAETLKGKTNDKGGVFRAGTGSAMFYIGHGSNLNATADGRLKGEEIPANYSPSLLVKCKGPISIIKSFTKPDLTKVINGGPLTLELQDFLFKNEDSIKKVAQMVKLFVDLGGHQFQLNAVNREKMIDAQINPNKYKNLIVRVWGWSGYFVELDKEYQDQIIKRVEYGNV